MGKASRWMINFLLGKREEKGKKKDISFHAERDTTPTAIVPSTPTYKRRWSFGKSAKKERVCKGRRSLDSIITAPYSANRSSFALPTTEAIKIIVTPTHGSYRIRKAVKDAAATRIQAVFRSYLARKALCALKGLVKLQALVRGHQVRKQTTATLRRMHTLMTIQARARCHRVQMAGESQLAVKSKSSRHTEAFGINLHEVRGVAKNTSGYMNYPLIDRVQREIPRFYSGEQHVSRREHQYKEFSFTAQNSPTISSPPSKTTPGRSSFTYERPDYVDTLSNQFQFQPNYMADTESSKAKVRSQSEPKQRPKESPRDKNKQTMNGLNAHQDARSQCSSSHSKHMAHENQDPWFIKLYRPTKSKDSDYDANITTSTQYSNYSKVLVTYEVS
ncbi:unnamed protein product [Dovyalis caffra]|uniref:DUF4005 domain-containing protein n=1 Tax=Dovyalis caffra TaxID=77055 RepID=A0AAV1RX70_9ROSI|nr:unnamed protein product [Dovyalis caffra]